MKITFIQPYYSNVWESLGLGYIIAYCKKYYEGNLEELEINFFQAKFDDHATILRGCVDSDIVAFSCTSPAYAHGLHLAKCIKNINPDVHTVFGGWHPTALPEEVIKEACVDQVIIGEGERAMLSVIDGNRIPILNKGNTYQDWLPWPDRATIQNERTIDLCESMNGQRTASFQMNRGCKVHCAFCSEHLMTGKYSKANNPIRSRKNADVLNEIESVRDQYNLNYFKFVDATFDINPEQVIAFCVEKIASPVSDLEWEANIHPGFVQNKDVFKWLKLANCNQINVGCESGSPKILKDVGKGTSIHHIKNVFKWAKEYNIKRRGYFLLGMPDERRYDLEFTSSLIDEIEPDVVGFTILCPYPGSDFYDSEKHKDVDWSKTDEYGNDFWRSNELTNSQLKNWQEYFLERYDHLLCERQVQPCQKT